MTDTTPNLPTSANANADLLQLLAQDDHPTSPAAIAKALGRTESANVKRTLARLAEDGLLALDDTGGAAELTDAGHRALLALDLAAGRLGASGDVTLRHDQLQPHPLNPRKDFDSPEAIQAQADLADAIVDRGLEQNLIVRATPDANGVRFIIGGERRWRAIGRAIADGRLPADYPIRCRLKTVTDAEHALDALAENLLRRDLTPIEEARAFKAATEAGTRTADLAVRCGRTQRFVQQRLQLIQQSAPVVAALEAGKINVEQARRLAGLCEADREAIASGAISVAEALARLEAADAPPAETHDTFARQLAQATRPEGDDPPRAEAPGDFLDPQEELILVEVQHLTRARPIDNPLGPAGIPDTKPDLKVSPAEANLKAGGYLDFDYQSVVLLKPALAYLSRLAFTLDDPETRLRKARERAGLDAETITRAEADELYATAWLNEKNPPPKLAPAEALVLLEIAHAKSASNHPYWGSEIRHDYDTAVVAALKDRGLVRSPSRQDGRTYLPSTWDADRGLTRYYPGWEKKAARAKHLAALRTAVLGEAEAAALRQGAYATAWLNGPFEIDPAIQEKLDKEAAEQTARQQRAEDQRAAEEALQARRAEAVDRLEADLPGLDAETRTARFAEVLALLNGPAPWSPPSNRYWGMATAANGFTIDNNSPLARRMAILAINIAAGVDLAALAAERAAPAVLSRADFLNTLAATMQASDDEIGPLVATRAAQLFLDSILENEGLAYGEPTDISVPDGGTAWTAAHAHQLLEDLDWSDDVMAAEEALAETGELPDDAEDDADLESELEEA